MRLAAAHRRLVLLAPGTAGIPSGFASVRPGDVALDNQTKYAEALTTADQAVSMTQESTTVGQLSRQEQSRLKQLAGSAPNAPPANQPKPAPTSPQTETPHP